MKYLVTGSSGFIGSYLCKKLLSQGHIVIGIDNESSYYTVELKKYRRSCLQKEKNFTFIAGDICDNNLLSTIFSNHHFDAVINLAAQAGVRYSIENPATYIQSNIVGFANLLENIRLSHCKKFIYASSSSVYGNSHDMPFEVNDDTNHPVSLYAATKKADELIAHSYSHLFGISTIGLRFFTVYGPEGRPDMAYFKFMDMLTKDNPILIYGKGDQKRDFTYIDDIVEGIIAAINYQNPTIYSIFNLGNGNPITVNQLISIIETAAGKKFTKQYIEQQPGDVENTWADINSSKEFLGRSPKTNIEQGITAFVKWYQKEYINL